MSEPGPTQTATPDELAALYLRARDVPCPNCNYNRRDGVAAACPECAHSLWLAPETPDHLPVKARFARFLLWSLTAFGAITISFGIYVLIVSPPGNFPTRMDYIYWAIGVVVPSVAMLVGIRYAIPAIRRSRTHRRAAARYFSLAILSFAAAQMFEARWYLIWILNALGWG
jgi:hypothetical protein